MSDQIDVLVKRAEKLHFMYEECVCVCVCVCLEGSALPMERISVHFLKWDNVQDYHQSTDEISTSPHANHVCKKLRMSNMRKPFTTYC